MNPTVWERLKWDSRGQAGVDARPDRAVMARSLTYLFGAGGTLGIVWLVLPHSPDAREVGMLGILTAAYAVALALLVAFDRIPMWGFQLIGACGTLLITGTTYFSDETIMAAILYVWVGLFSFYFFTRAQAVLQLGFAAAAYAVVLLIEDRAPASITRWVLIVSTLAVAGILIGALRERLERLIARLADAARTDPLTGLLNRRGFADSFDLELERARRAGRRLGVLVGDLDRFKEINDHFGHHAGDEALKRVSAALGDAKRRIDTAARMGGEEFALIVPDAGEEGAYMLAERLRGELKHAFAGDPVPLSISFGIASFPAHGKTTEALLHAADQALYAAKALGRDRSVVHSVEIAEILATVSSRDGEHEGFLAIVLALAETLDIRDTGTARHSGTVGRYAEMIARELGLPAGVVERVRLAGILHDVGKVGVPDSVLRKPGSLTKGEWAVMRRHPEIGARILDHISLDDIRKWVLTHQERPDGRGYPRGLNGDEIPLEAKIIAVADAYEAMTSHRAYRPARSYRAARAELVECTGVQFDERVVDAFLRVLEHQGLSARPHVLTQKEAARA